MASKFQNRLVGTIIIVALGVIILPGLLDGKKKHYQDEFAAIPLVPKAGDTEEAEVAPQANQSLPSQPPEGAGAALKQSIDDTDAGSADENNQAAPQAIAPPAMKPSRPEPVKPKPEAKPKPDAKPVNKPLAPKVDNKPVAKPEPIPEAVTEPKPATAPPAPAQTAEQPPKGQAWVVQLGALKNAAKVSEIVAKLRLSGYRAFTVPATPVQGEITRIFVGPDASKQKLQSALPELNQASGLSGQIRPYSVR